MSHNLLGPRDENGLPVPVTLDESIAKLKSTLLNNIRRSAYVYRVDCGGCNGCEIEIFSTLSPIFDPERFGIKVVPSPRHADILLFTGAVTRAMRIPALRAWESAPDPKISISYGACGNSGGIFHDLYCVWGGTDKIVPVDVYIPGCPPSPAATIYGFALALACWIRRLTASSTMPPPPSLPPCFIPPCRSRCACCSTAKRDGWRAIAMAARLPIVL